MKFFTYYRNVVEYFMEKKSFSLSQAMEEAEVPPNMKEQLRDYFNADPATINISIIKDSEEDIVLCEPTDDLDSQPYLNDFIEFTYNVRKWPRSVAKSLTLSSKTLLENLPDPRKNQSFQHKGLVIGHIQSGKTANISALIARAADYGYRFFIVLAGRYKDLRLQTQNRMDQDITGQTENPFECVEHSPDTPNWLRMTIGDILGDFKRGTVNFDPNPDTPKLAVIKKNTTVMKKFINWLKGATVPMTEFPALIIDDECDDASININYAEEDDEPSKTNKRIRDLLNVFEKSVYVGFSATPYANVLTDADESEDLYPKNFITVLDEPRDYFGPRQLFGLGMNPSELSDPEAENGIPELDVIRPIQEDTDREEGIREIIKKSILTFILSCCARMARGQSEKHFSMLIHPSHKIDQHKLYREVVRKEIVFFESVARYPKRAKGAISEAKEVWENDFCKISEEAEERRIDFDDVWKFAKQIIQSIEVVVLNTDSDDYLEYDKSSRRYIVIGGNRLSRGLTLEGLSVSLYLRPTPSGGHKYDTLLQMGRWFGYRKGYYDLTRVFVHAEIADNFADLARVELEFREDLKKYSRDDPPLTPRDISPLIRAHSTMQVTSPMKFGAGKKINLSLQAGIKQTVAFPLDDLRSLRNNQEVTKEWIKSLEKNSSAKHFDGYYAWKDIEPRTIIELIQNYTFSEEATQVNGEILKGYISRQNEEGELTKWAVVLPPGPKNGDFFPWTPDISTKKVTRRLNKRKTKGRTAIKVLTESKHIDKVREVYSISPDLSSDSEKGALLIYVIDKDSGKETEQALFPDDSGGEDIIGLAFIFPKSKSQATIPWVTQ